MPSLDSLLIALPFALLLTGTAFAQPAAPADSAAAPLHRLFDDHFEWQKRESPDFARSLGDDRYADRIADDSLAAIERRHRERQQFLERLTAIDRGTLAAEDQLNYDLFRWLIAGEVEGHAYRAFLAPLDGRSGPHTEIPEMHVRSRFASAADYENYIRRLAQVPGRVAATLEALRAGVAEGRTVPRVAVEDVPAQFEALLGEGLAALAEPFDRWPATVEPAEQAALRKKFDETMPALRSALAEFQRYLRDEYVPACRTSIAARDWPDGEAWYGHQLRQMTTTSMTAREIHELGLAEVARIRAEMMEVIRRSDFLQHHPDAAGLPDGELFARFLAYLRSDPRFYHRTPADLMIGYRDICKRIDAELPRLFGRLPQQPYGVREIPAFMAPTQTTAYYSPGNMKSGEPGWYYANTYRLDQRPKYEMIALSLHEAVPGHHLQIAIASELEGLPEFRKSMWVTAYGEGWALYAERLGIEMGLYEDPYDDFGRLLYEMWRACRLVVDPGMHVLGWTRAQAVQFMLDNTALSEQNINAEVDRYIAWPGQACAYKLGELRIRAMRARAEHRLGERFNVRSFHDMLLSAGPLPLELLDQRVDNWIAAQQD